MKSGKNSLKQLIESTINAWCCCDVPDNDRVKQLEKELNEIRVSQSNRLHKLARTHTRLRQEILGHEITQEIERDASCKKFHSMHNASENAHVYLVIISAILIISVIINIGQALSWI
jgi:hypothetical protein